MTRLFGPFKFGDVLHAKHATNPNDLFCIGEDPQHEPGTSMALCDGDANASMVVEYDLRYNAELVVARQDLERCQKLRDVFVQSHGWKPHPLPGELGVPGADPIVGQSLAENVGEAPQAAESEGNTGGR